jgi:hypothetical protein
VKKQRHFDEEMNKREELKREEIDNCYERYTNLDEISKKGQEIIRNFINSIEPRRN